MKMKNKTS